MATKMIFQSYNGVFAGILVENGKVLDVKPNTEWKKGNVC